MEVATSEVATVEGVVVMAVMDTMDTETVETTVEVVLAEVEGAVEEGGMGVVVQDMGTRVGALVEVDTTTATTMEETLAAVEEEEVGITMTLETTVEASPITAR